MPDFQTVSIRPYQMLCLVCRQGCPNKAEPYHHASRLDEIQSAIAANPIVPLTLRLNTETIFRYQNPGREHDTPEGDDYNDLRDLAIIQRLGVTPGDTRPAIDWFQRVVELITSTNGFCAHPPDQAPGWPRCRLADSGNYERGVALGAGAVVLPRSPEEKSHAKQASATACDRARRLKVRPHHLMCLACFHDGRSDDALAPIQEDNLYEVIRTIQRDPEIPVELVRGTCMICPPCSSYHPPTGLCIGGRSMGLRDEKKDLDALRRLGLHYGDVLPARDLLQRLFGAIKSTTEICGHGDGVERSREWRICNGPTGSQGYIRARDLGMGVPGAKPDADPNAPDKGVVIRLNTLKP